MQSKAWASSARQRTHTESHCALRVNRWSFWEQASKLPVALAEVSIDRGQASAVQGERDHTHYGYD